jgi:hypothetical protein
MIIEDIVPYVAGIFWSLALAYIPKMKDWYASLTGDIKRLVMVGFLALSALAIWGMSCTGWQILPMIAEVPCDIKGVQLLVRLFIAALLANQTTYLLAIKGRGEPDDC